MSNSISFLYKPDVTETNVQITLMTKNVPIGSTVSLSSKDIDSNPAIYIAPTEVTTSPVFSAGVKVNIDPSTSSGTITMTIDYPSEVENIPDHSVSCQIAVPTAVTLFAYDLPKARLKEIGPVRVKVIKKVTTQYKASKINTLLQKKQPALKVKKAENAPSVLAAKGRYAAEITDFGQPPQLMDGNNKIVQKIQYDQGTIGSQMQVMVVTENVPIGSYVTFIAANPGPTPPLYLPPTKVTIYSKFSTGIVTYIPANWKSEITTTVTAPPGSDLSSAKVSLQATYPSVGAELC